MTEEQHKVLFEDICLGHQNYYKVLSDFLTYAENELIHRPFIGTIKFQNPYGDYKYYRIELDSKDEKMWYQEIRRFDPNEYLIKKVKVPIPYDWIPACTKDGQVGLLRENVGKYNFFSGMTLRYENGFTSLITDLSFSAKGFEHRTKTNISNGRQYIQLTHQTRGHNIYIDEVIYHTWSHDPPTKEHNHIKHINGDLGDNRYENLLFVRDTAYHKPRLRKNAVVVTSRINNSIVAIFDNVNSAAISLNLDRRTIEKYARMGVAYHGYFFEIDSTDHIYYNVYDEEKEWIDCRATLEEIIVEYDLDTNLYSLASTSQLQFSAQNKNKDHYYIIKKGYDKKWTGRDNDYETEDRD